MKIFGIYNGKKWVCVFCAKDNEQAVKKFVDYLHENVAIGGYDGYKLYQIVQDIAKVLDLMDLYKADIKNCILLTCDLNVICPE